MQVKYKSVKMKNLLVLITVFILSGCAEHSNKQVNKAEESKKVAECYKEYKNAILEQRGNDAVKCIDERTILYYKTMLQTALTADSATVQKLGVLDKAMVLTTRVRIPNDTIVTMNDTSFFVYAVNSGMIGKNSVKSFDIDNIEIDGEFAKGQIVSKGKKSPLFFAFHKEGGRWKIDLTSVFKSSKEGMEMMIKKTGLSEDEFILYSISYITGEKNKTDVWHPIVE